MSVLSGLVSIATGIAAAILFNAFLFFNLFHKRAKRFG